MLFCNNSNLKTLVKICLVHNERISFIELQIFYKRKTLSLSEINSIRKNIKDPTHFAHVQSLFTLDLFIILAKIKVHMHIHQ